ncbi:hypothetical protein LX32DRAFT_318718 [Colletotrichum zoysiae]|uniref:Uncharacterized protein n=1 Tax=Colletotrichum zoysiae TaxID=1216348 RepID=A0AAD9H170_9PEZI|nr:hypothetical protein LX32DRAFT_318718 [Colletotrichum zoysiae]
MFAESYRATSVAFSPSGARLKYTARKSLPEMSLLVERPICLKSEAEWYVRVDKRRNAGLSPTSPNRRRASPHRSRDWCEWGPRRESGLAPPANDIRTLFIYLLFVTSSRMIQARPFPGFPCEMNVMRCDIGGRATTGNHHAAAACSRIITPLLLTFREGGALEVRWSVG